MQPFAFILLLASLWGAAVSPVFAQFNGDGLQAVYYASPNLSSPAVTLVDPFVSYLWFGCPPQMNLPGNSFSVRWTGQIEPAYSEPYTFIADVNGGVSVLVNGQVLISKWTDYPLPIRGFSGVVTLTAGVKVPIEVDYFTNGANPTSSRIQLVWQSASQANGLVPRPYLYSGATLNPTPTPQTASACQAAIQVDGILNDWPWSGSSGWSHVSRTVLGNGFGASADFKTLWDASHLYLAVTVADGQLTNTGSASSWRNSTVELYLDTAPTRSVTLTDQIFEYFFRWNDTAASETQDRTTGVIMRTTTLPTGYLLEASIPWSTLGLGTPAAGTALGFDLGIDVDHNGGDCRDGQLIWNGGSDNYANSSGYARLVLSDACPTPVSTPPVPAGGEPYAAPNPSDGGTVRFIYTMAETGTAKIKVWNAWGHQVASLSDPRSAGLQSSALNLASFAPGHYFYRIELDYASGKQDAFKTRVLAVKK